MAWLYAIPYERFLTPVEAVQANLLTLGAVSAWRVALMVRVLHVLFGYGLWSAFAVVMAFADAVAVAALQFLPVPLMDIMGGIRLSPSDEVLRGTACGICQLGICSAPIWFATAITSITTSRLAWSASPPLASSAPTWPLWTLALGSVVIWFAVLPLTQPEQQLRSRVERMFADGRIKDALSLMSAHDRAEFPPHWQPPPRRLSRFGTDESLVNICKEVMTDPAPADWIRQLYLDRLRDWLQTDYFQEPMLHKVADLLKQIPESAKLLADVERSEERYQYRSKENVDKLREILRRTDAPMPKS